MTKQEISDMLEERGFEGTMLYSNPDYADAFIGVTFDGIAMYDYDRMVQCLVRDGMDEMKAIEWVDFNCVGSKGAGLPMVVNITNPDYQAKDLVISAEELEAAEDGEGKAIA